MSQNIIKILLVEDSIFFGEMVRKRLTKEYGFTVEWVKGMTQAEQCLAQSADFFAAILDYNLPDARKGEVVKLVVGRKIPAIVFTASVDDEVRDDVWSNKVVDYVLKGDRGSLVYIAELILRLRANSETQVLVVDDSPVFQQIIARLLKVHGYRINLAASGTEALEKMAEQPDTKLVVVDYNMPGMTGLELTSALRQKYGREKLAIIGMSGEGKGVMAASFIKHGANDFIVKQRFLTEEFYCRVNQNIDYVNHLQQIREAAIRDHLTGLYNRRYFFDMGGKLFANAQRKLLTISCAMIDIDFFKNVNDTYGHEAGDKVLRAVADLLKSRMRRSDLVARVGGEEFCILTTNKTTEEDIKVFEELRQKIEQMQVPIDRGRIVSVTISMGITTIIEPSLEIMMKKADKLLYQAKENGRNRAVIL